MPGTLDEDASLMGEDGVATLHVEPDPETDTTLLGSDGPASKSPLTLKSGARCLRWTGGLVALAAAAVVIVYVATYVGGGPAVAAPADNSGSPAVVINEPNLPSAPAENGLYGELGCFADDSTIHALAYDLLVSQQMTVPLCAEHCSTAVDKAGNIAGYTHFGLESGGNCLCGFEGTHAIYGALNPDQCSAQCNGDASQSCGGDDALQVFKFGPAMCDEPSSKLFANMRDVESPLCAGTNSGDSCAITCRSGFHVEGTSSLLCYDGQWVSPFPVASCELDIYSELGCFSDDSTIRVLAYDLLASSEMTVQLCAEHCSTAVDKAGNIAGYTHFGLESGGICLCGFEGTHATNGALNRDRCSTPCNGQASQSCGGDEAMEVFKF